MKRVAIIQPRMMTFKETMTYWNLSANTFRKLMQQGVAPGPLNIPGLGRHLFDREGKIVVFTGKQPKHPNVEDATALIG